MEPGNRPARIGRRNQNITQHILLDLSTQILNFKMKDCVPPFQINRSLKGAQYLSEPKLKGKSPVSFKSISRDSGTGCYQWRVPM